MQHISRRLIDALFLEAESSPRKRAFHTFHKEDDMFNRVLIAGFAGSYAAPHRHTEKLEVFTYIEGGVIVVEFKDDGTIKNAYDLQQCRFVEISPMAWHMLVYTTERWAVMEFALWKEKYNPADKDFAPWAPREGTEGSEAYSRQLTQSARSLITSS